MDRARKLANEPVESKVSQDKIRVTVTIPDEIRDLFAWYLTYDATYNGNAAGLAADMLRTGLLAKYHEGLAETPATDDEIYESIAKHQKDAFKKGVGE